jgi:hypothetical protein
MTDAVPPIDRYAAHVSDLTARIVAMNAVLAAAQIPVIRGPRQADDSTLVVDGFIRYNLIVSGARLTIEVQERDKPHAFAWFSRFLEAEKFLLWLLWDGARGYRHLETKDMQWWAAGPDPRVDIGEDGHRRILTLSNEPDSECTVNSVGDAVSFTHAMVLTLDELEAELRAGL